MARRTSSHGQAAQPRRRFTPRAVILAMLVTLLLAEIVAESLPGIPHSAVTVADPRMGFRKLPNQHFVGPRGVTVQINSEGYRDREWTRPGEADSLRVAILGQSMAYGAHVEVEETFGRELEALLQSRIDRSQKGRRAIVMNLALPGYRLEQMVRAYESCAKRYSPDVVVVATTAHDIQVMPRTVSSGPGPIACWMKRRALYRVASHLTESYVRLPVLRRREELAGGRVPRVRVTEADPGTVQRPFAPVQEPKWELARQAMERLRQQIARDGGTLVVLCLPMLKNVTDPSLPHHAEIWERWSAGKLGVRVLDSGPVLRSSMASLLTEMRENGHAPDAIWRRSKTGKGPAAALELDHATESNYLFFDPYHFSPRGHQVLAAWLDVQLADLAGGT